MARGTRIEMGDKSRARALGAIVNSDGSETVVFRDNSKEILASLDDAKARILTMIGLKAEGYAKKLCPVGTEESTGIKGYRGGTLRNSITFRVEGEELAVGSNVEYAPYVELGTGPHFKPPPEWETFDTERGSGVGRSYVRPRPYLRPAIEDHKGEYEELARKELKR